MINRRNLLKLVPAGIVGTLFPAKKLFANENSKIETVRKTFKFYFCIAESSMYKDRMSMWSDLYQKNLVSEETYLKETRKYDGIDIYKKVEYNVHKLTFIYPVDLFADKNCRYSFCSHFRKEFSCFVYDKKGKSHYSGCLGTNPEMYHECPDYAVFPKEEWIDRDVKIFAENYICNRSGDRPFKDVYVHIFRRKDLPYMSMFSDRREDYPELRIIREFN